MYDEEKRVCEMRLNGEGAIIPGHSSRVFCVKFDKNCLKYYFNCHNNSSECPFFRWLGFQCYYLGCSRRLIY